MFSFPNVILRDPCKYSISVPIATKTCDGAVEPVLHAEPVDAHIPFSSSFNNKSPPSTPLN